MESGLIRNGEIVNYEFALWKDEGDQKNLWVKTNAETGHLKGNAKIHQEAAIRLQRRISRKTAIFFIKSQKTEICRILAKTAIFAKNLFSTTFLR